MNLVRAAGLAALLAATLPMQPQALAAAPALNRADYDACQADNNADLRKAVETVTYKALSSGLTRLELAPILEREWREGGLDEIINTRVDLAVAEISEETSLAGHLRSLANSEKAKELATAVAERVFRSEAIHKAIELLAANVGKGIGGSIDVVTADAAEPVSLCLSSFLGPRYGSSVARAITREAASAFVVKPGDVAPDVTTGDILLSSRGGLAGVAVLIVRRQLSRMASRIGQRVVGSVLGRLVSVAAGGVGLVLIAKDIWELRRGVMPIIAEELKSADTKARIREEIRLALAQEISDQMKEIAAATTDRVLETWTGFRQAHAQVLSLAERHAGFRRLLDETPAGRLARLDEIVAILAARHGEAGVLERMESGALRDALTGIDDPGMEIARDLKSVDAALAWQRLARERTGEVVRNAIHKRTTPETLQRAVLMRLLDLGDPLAVGRIAAVSPDVRLALLELDNDDLKRLARGLNESELVTLASYMTGLDKAPRERVLRAVAAQPARMQVLSSERVRDAIVASRDQLAAVAMMLRADALLEPTGLVEDVRRVADGAIRPILLWEKHPHVAGIAAVALLLILLMLRRLFSLGRRPSRTSPEAGSRAA
ncbi:MAG: hypothetical protein R3D27_02185 [Hyphomicrobiaceae bacterium]